VSLLTSIDAEMAVIGSILYDNEAVYSLGNLAPDDFSEPILGRLYAKCLELISAGRYACPITLTPLVADDPAFKSIGGQGLLISLVSSGSPVYLAAGIAQTVVDLSRRRALLAAAKDIEIRATEFDGAAVADLINWASARFSDAIEYNSIDRSASGFDVIGQAVTAAETWRDAPEYASGLFDLDKVLGGFQRGELCILAGRPGMGKSIVGLNLARFLAQQGHGVSYFSLEMSARSLGLRLACDLTFQRGYMDRMPAGLMMSDFAGMVSPDRIDDLRAVQKTIRGLPLAIDCRTGLTVAEIERTARRQFREWAKAGVTPGPIIVDHLGLVRSAVDRRGQRHAEVADISRGLAEMAKRLDVPVIALCQLNRGVEGRDDKRPMLSDLRQAGELEEDARQVLLLHRPAYYLRSGPEGESVDKQAEREIEAARVAHVLNVIVAKNSNGPTQEVRVFIDISRSVIRDW
jgi:replicative DNA helicase